MGKHCAQGIEVDKSIKTPYQQAVEAIFENDVKDELYRSREGAALAYLTSKYWTSQTRVLLAQQNFNDALHDAALALYFATLACGVNSLQTALQIYSVAKLGSFSGKFLEIQSVNALVEAQKIFKSALLQFYSPLITQIEIMKVERKMPLTYGSSQLRKLVSEYNKADSMREEDKLSFRADIKEAIQSAVFSMDHLERAFGQQSLEYNECVLIIAVGLSCVEDIGKEEWVPQSTMALTKFTEVSSVDEDGKHALLVHIYKCLYE